MTTLDLTPLFRSVVGIDRMAPLLDSAMGHDENSGYPPYNIEKHSEEHYRITMAVAGFTLEDIKIVSHDGLLTVQGSTQPQHQENVTYLHRGIASRAFKRRFQLADSIKVVSASLASGVLCIELVREIPEAKKPREIKIEAEELSNSKTLDGSKAKKIATVS
ncbi:MAG: Hsp20 family protein [Holosporaceae bacterium]